MALRAVALKEEGTDAASEGVLAQFAQLRPIRTLTDLERVQEERPDIVLVDMRMAQVEGKEVVEVLRHSRRAPVVVLFDSQMPPALLLKRLNGLSNLKTAAHRRAPNLSRAVRLLGVSQEMLSRILKVSGRTAHRWLKGTRPRRTRELERLLEVVALLQRALPNDEAIRSYLQHSNPALEGERPIEVLIRGEFERVTADLQAVEEGVYV